MNTAGLRLAVVDPAKLVEARSFEGFAGLLEGLAGGDGSLAVGAR